MQGQTKHGVFESQDELRKLWLRMKESGKSARKRFAHEVEAIWNAMRGIDDDSNTYN